MSDRHCFNCKKEVGYGTEELYRTHADSKGKNHFYCDSCYFKLFPIDWMWHEENIKKLAAQESEWTAIRNKSEDKHGNSLHR